MLTRHERRDTIQSEFEDIEFDQMRVNTMFQVLNSSEDDIQSIPNEVTKKQHR
jgi:hypothetical protein